MMYKLYKTIDGKDAAITIGIEPQSSFLFDENNPDYKAYLIWLSEGNEPLPPDEVTE